MSYTPSTMRDGEVYGNIILSVQASRNHYSNPRTDGLPLDQYKSVEVAMFPNKGDGWLRPSDIGLPELDTWWGDDDVAGYVPLEVVEVLRNKLKDAL